MCSANFSFNELMKGSENFKIRRKVYVISQEDKYNLLFGHVIVCGEISNN